MRCLSPAASFLQSGAKLNQVCRCVRHQSEPLTVFPERRATPRRSVYLTRGTHLITYGLNKRWRWVCVSFVKSAGQSVTPASPRTSARDAEQGSSSTWASARRPARRDSSATKLKGNALPVRTPMLFIFVFWVGFRFHADRYASARLSLQSARQTASPA